MKKGIFTIITCGHDDRVHMAFGLCEPCYKKKHYKENRDRYIHKTKSNRVVRRNTSLPIVYAYFNKDGVCDYVGRGTIERSLSHKWIKNSSWWTKNHTLLSMTCETEWQAMELEGRWGGRYLPKFNKEGYRHQQ